MAASETFSFQAEVTQLLDLVVNSLYSNKEVFLRELVSNASDAVDKLRFRSLTEPNLVKPGAPLEIRIATDEAAGTLTIADTGVGMTHDELVRNLGTIAHSGTKGFLEAVKSAGKLDVNLIGQFGVGFYSAYLVAERVDVVSRAVGSDEAYRWSSDGKSGFKVEPAERAECGTSVILHLKGDQKEFLESWRIEDLVRRYSDFVGYPIKLLQGETEDGKADSEPSWVTINKANALWQRPKGEVTDEQHAEFYKHLTHDGAAPLARTHFTIEGTQVFTALLYVPSKAPVFELESDRRGVRLFVKRVFIMDDCRELLPPWLRFVRGVVDSDDLPLNVSREILQDSQIVRTIRKQVVKKVLDLLDEMAAERPDDYIAFYKEFGVCLKEGLATDWEHRERLAKLLRYTSTKGEGLVSLPRYVERAPLAQKAIFFVLGESEESLKASPYLEALTRKGLEVLLMTEPIDQYVVESLREFDKKPLVSAMSSDRKFDEQDEAGKAASKQAEEQIQPFLAKAKEVLGAVVADVKVSERLTDSPCCLVIGAGQHHALFEQALRNHGKALREGKRTLEVNPNHPLVKTLGRLAQSAPSDARLSDWIQLLHDQALLTESNRVSDPNRFARMMTSLLQEAASAAASPTQ